MKLFIAEKPELGKAIARAIGHCDFKDGYIEVNNNIVTWAFGHLLQLKMPEEYDQKYKLWKLEDLPFDINITDLQYKPIEKSKKQLNIIQSLMKDKKVTEIIHAGDADEEGQILIEEILNYFNNKKPVKRILIADLTDTGVKKALNNIQDNSLYYGLSQRGFARSHADWLVGLNLTRAYTLSAQKMGLDALLSVGRVQTPILSLIVSRDKENASHQKIKYFSLKAYFNINNIEVISTPILPEKITNPAIVDNIKKDCLDQTGTITEAKHESKKEYPPLPYSLLQLQIDASTTFGYKPDKVLSITQSLRETHKLITYNRSDCSYLPESVFKDSPDIFNAIKNNIAHFSSLIEKSDLNIKGKCFNDENITAHHGIIPTIQNINIDHLSTEEKHIYELICKRFILQFFEPEEYIQSSIIIKIHNHLFNASSKFVTKKTFKTHINSDTNEDDLVQLKDYRSIEIHHPATCVQIKSEEKETKPKALYKMASLLKDLTSVAKYIKDQKLKELLQDKDKDKKGENGGIGTPATRSEHIAKLFARNFIIEDGKKNIISTDLGKNFIKILPDLLVTPDMTAIWQEQQLEIEKNNLSRSEFLNGIQNIIKDQISTINSKSNFEPLTDHLITCPTCNKGHLIRRPDSKKKGAFWWGCSGFKDGCKATFQDDKGKPLFIEKITCPTCNKGHLIRRPDSKKKGAFWWGCSGFKDGCKATFQDTKGNPLIK